MPVLSDPTLSGDVLALARQMAGPQAGPEREELARGVAAACADLWRVRAVHYELISRALRDPEFDSRKNWNKKVTAALRVIARCSRSEHVLEEDAKLLSSTLSEPERFATVFVEIARRFPALDRYQRRALSRLKWAMRAFDAASSRPFEQVAPTSVSGTDE